MSAMPSPEGAQRWVLGLTSAAQFVLQLNVAIVNVALPTVQRELGFSPAELQWIVTGYALTFGALLLLGGRLGDVMGHRRALVIGLAVFGLSSLSGGLATGPIVLVISRLIQGAGAALIAPAALALLARAYPEPRERTQAMGIFQGSVAGGALAGILAGGLISQFAGWRWVLLINLPLIALLLALVRKRLPSVAGHTGIRLDLPGALTATAAIGALVLGVSQGEDHGFTSWPVWLLLGSAAVLTAILVAVERRSPDPMLPPNILRKGRPVMLVATLAIGAVLAGYIYFVSLYLQQVLGLSPGLTGLALAPATAMVMLMSVQVSKRLLQRVGTTWQLVIALSLICGGQFWLSYAPAHGSYIVNVLGPILLTSAGLGLALPAASLAVIHGAAPHQRGIAGALFAAGQQVGSAVGLAALAAAAAASTAATGELLGGYRLAFLAIAAVAATACVAVVAHAVGRRTEEAEEHGGAT